MDFNSYRDPVDLFRLFIFLITSVCVGLPALIWASRVVYLHRKSSGRMSALILLLLLLYYDLLQLLLNVWISTHPSFINVFFHFWFSLNLGGLQLHQLVALEGVLTLKYPLFARRFFSLPCYIIITIFAFVFFIPSILTLASLPCIEVLVLFCNIITSLASLVLLAVTCKITCKAPPTPAIGNTHLVFAVALVTFMLYLPFMLVICVNFVKIKVNSSWIVMSLCLMSLRVISDPLLCVLVCRENIRDVQTRETHTEPNTDLTAELT